MKIEDELLMTTRQVDQFIKILKVIGDDYDIESYEISRLPDRWVKVNFKWNPRPSCDSSEQKMKTENIGSEFKAEWGDYFDR